MLSPGFFRTLLPLLMFACFLGTGRSGAAVFANETLKYDIVYKWGMIHKKTANATLSLRSSGNNYILSLTARTLPWADRYFIVRDTLTSVVAKSDLTPQSYLKISHEGKYYGRDQLKFKSVAGGLSCQAECEEIYKGQEKKLSSKHLSAQGPGFDMLSVFYYLRVLDFDRLDKGKAVKVNIFSGSKVETLTIRGLGKETLRMAGKKERATYKVVFSFTMGGKKRSSEEITAWISDDASRIVLRLIGKLPVGEVQVNLQ